ncbi:MAG: family 10 glycosylhydrolase [Anaerovoracaceae bacterium]
MKKKVISLLMCAVMVFSVFAGLNTSEAEAYRIKEGKEVKGLWVGFCDFEELGLKTTSEETFRKNTAKLLDRAKTYRINTVYFHARAFQDATYRSETYKASKYMSSSTAIASEAFANFDPLEIFVQEAHKRKMELHAWLNPYRITYDTFLDPAKESSTNDIKNAIREIMEYDVDGFHFDDYFYHSSKYYKDLSTGKRYTINTSEAAKRKNVNNMIKSVRKMIKDKDQTLRFGISPQGNYDNAMKTGADIKTWLASDEYVDYVTPQIYWTDDWGTKGGVTMFTNRLNQFSEMRVNKDVKMYIGLALYRANKSFKDDKGWKKSQNNMSVQIDKLRAAGMDGFVFFSAPNLFSSTAKQERINMKPQIANKEYLY